MALDDTIFETTSSDARFTISTDRARLDIDYLHAYLSERSYWAQGRPRATVEKSIRHSLCFGLYDGDRQIGFARVVTDYTIFAWLCDVFVDEAYRSRGLGKWLVDTVVNHAELCALGRFMLTTSDAHNLYRRYGFDDLVRPDRLLARTNH